MFCALVYEVLYGYMGRISGVAGIIQTHAIFFERMWAFSSFTFIMHFVAYASSFSSADDYTPAYKKRLGVRAEQASPLP